jgi:hypothetical protein
MSEQKKKNDEIVEEITLKGQEVIEFIKNLIQKGNVRRVIVRQSNGKEILELPLTAAVVGAGALTVFATPLAFLAGIVAFLAEVKLEVVREVTEDEPEEVSDTKKKIDIE